MWAMNSKQANFYRDKPLFGLDIGFNSIKVIQITPGKKGRYTVGGYGATSFDASAIRDGVIVDIKSIAKDINALFRQRIIGDINTRRVAVSVPSSRTYSQMLTLPKMPKKDLRQAILSEAEQYIPVQLDSLYLDFSIIRETPEGIDLQIVAVPKEIIDSYFTLMLVLGLETVAIETNINSSSRLFVRADRSNVPTILIDFGSASTDITINYKGPITTGTVAGGGDNFTKLIAESLSVSQAEAQIIKTRYGLGVSKRQSEITKALKPSLEQLSKEVRRMIRYYEERSIAQGAISQIVTMGGGANMPGLSDYLTDHLRLATRMCDPWQTLTFDKLQPPSVSEKTLYITATGLAMIQPKEAFQ